jgi:hypothetical protein
MSSHRLIPYSRTCQKRTELRNTLQQVFSQPASVFYLPPPPHAPNVSVTFNPTFSPPEVLHFFGLCRVLILEQLAKTAGPDNLETQGLFRAGRDNWPKMLVEARGDLLNLNEQEFQQQLQDFELSIQNREENRFIFVMIVFDISVVLASAWW